MLKKLIKTGIKTFIQGTCKTLPRLPGGKYIFQQFLEVAMGQYGLVQHKSTRMLFTTPNALCRYRLNSFSTKEPETLEWIDTLPEGAVLWDIGANVGLYSIYAALHRKARVFAFEPSVFNLELLARNIHLNGLHEQIVILPIALSDTLGPSLFRMSNTQWGGALSTFDKMYGQDGRTLNTQFKYQIYGMTIQDAITRLGLPLPHYIKIDVDGIEHLILAGGPAVLVQVDSVLVEINEEFPEQTENAAKLLSAAGLTLKRKCAMMDAKHLTNQWWVRPVSNEKLVS